MLCGNSNPRLGSREHAAGVQTAAVQKPQHRSASQDTSLVLWSDLSSWEMPCWTCCWPEPQLSVLPPQSWWLSELLWSGISDPPCFISPAAESRGVAFPYFLQVMIMMETCFFLPKTWESHCLTARWVYPARWCSWVRGVGSLSVTRRNSCFPLSPLAQNRGSLKKGTAATKWEHLGRNVLRKKYHAAGTVWFLA